MTVLVCHLCSLLHHSDLKNPGVLLIWITKILLQLCLELLIHLVGADLFHHLQNCGFAPFMYCSALQIQ
jgi:hypothetical protein